MAGTRTKSPHIEQRLNRLGASESGSHPPNEFRVWAVSLALQKVAEHREPPPPNHPLELFAKGELFWELFSELFVFWELFLELFLELFRELFSRRK